MLTLPTIFHITHWKAGSQWVAEILKYAASDRFFVKPKVGVAHFYEDELVPGAVYPTTYVPFHRFEATLYPNLDLDEQLYIPSLTDHAEIQNWYHFRVQKSPVIKFFVIRDLRDAIISLYFSLKISHSITSERVSEGRRSLNTMKFEDGLIYLLNTKIGDFAEIQSSWLPACKAGDVLLVRYEDLIAHEQEEFAKIIEHCQIDVSPQKLADIVGHNSFSKRAGRNPGEEDTSSHYRKGISGDWKNYFTDRIKAEFKEKFGQTLIDTGYEQDLNW